MNGLELLLREGAVVGSHLMSEELGNLVCLPGLNLFVKALDDHLTDPLACPHDIGGVHCLICTDEDEAFTPVRHGCKRCLIGSDCVILDDLAGHSLHERDMFVRRRMIYDLRAVLLKHLEHFAAVPYGSDQYIKVQLRKLLLQLHLQLIGTVLVEVQNDQFLRMVSRDLPAEL